MNLLKALLAGTFALGLGALVYWGVARALQPPLTCQVCSRPVHPGQEYAVVLTDGTEEHTCCPRCGLHFRLQHSDQLRSELATDYSTGQRIDPASAWFVEGSALMTCCAATPMIREQPQKTVELIWDRCLPSMVAFQTRAEALAFNREYGGRILTYQQALDSVRTR